MRDTNVAFIIREDPTGMTVSCSLKTWNEHIVSNHTDLKDHMDWVSDAITKPDFIRRDIYDEKVRIYYSRYHSAPLFIRVVVKEKKENQGQVITARYSSDKKPGESLLWYPPLK